MEKKDTERKTNNLEGRAMIYEKLFSSFDS